MYEIFEQLLQKYGVTTYQVSKATGIGQSTFSSWKNRRNLISMEKARLIASYFGVSVDYLMTGKEPDTDKEPALRPKDERDIAKRLETTLAELEDSQEALMFSGEPLDDETRELLKASLENSIRIAKINAKQKFTPKKYRNNNE
jgi:transcriptional regulator with XRE-family HTH domain